MDLEPEVEQALRFRAKTELRKRARALRATIPAQALSERSAKIVEHLEALVAELGSASVALFWPIEGRNEVDLRALDGWLRTRGARVAYPSIDPETRRMTFREVSSPGELEERGLGFQEPPPEAAELEKLDLIVVPALQLDLRGHRIGYGAGYYDATLPRFAPPAKTVGVGFKFQLIAEVPDTAGDVPLDAVLTDAGIALRRGSLAPA
jgi:5-formyltetrahydrofolate cyclo-ligase